MKLTVYAQGKINWSLSICGDRPDGYHDLDMLMQSIDLSDVLTFENARWLTLDVDGQRLPTGDRNLVIRAANALNETMGVDHYISWFNIPTLDRKSALKSMERFAKEVIPMFKKSEPAPTPKPVPQVATA